MPGDILCCCDGGVDALDIQWVEARDTTKCSQCTGQLPTTKAYPTRSIDSASVEKSRARLYAYCELT